MNENEQKCNAFDMKNRAISTHKYIDLWLHPKNNERAVYFVQALFTAIYIYNGDLERLSLIKNMTKTLNQRLDHPLSKDEQNQLIDSVITQIDEQL
ncbi:hypothetical protein [Weissella minor]|uniref:hypothetical protein n=1 Tax=Weissella minor TaxID=1620 RepID=UPI003AF2C443